MPSHVFKYPLPKLTLGLVAGIFASKAIEWPLVLVGAAIAVAIASIILSQCFSTIRAKILGHGAAMSLVFFLGIFSHIMHHPTFSSKHYSHWLTPNQDAPKQLFLRLKKPLKPTAYNWRYYAEVVRLDSQHVSGKIVLNIRKDSINPDLNPDDKLAIYAPLKPIESPKNLHSFNYKKFLQNQGVMHQLSIMSDDYLVFSSSKHSLLGMSATLKIQLEKQIDQFPVSKTAQAFIKALFLGNRNEIPENIKMDYKNAGVLHVLALSGLHVGILLLLFRSILTPLLVIKYGKSIRSVLLVLALWGFAMLTGLSPSIVRAVSMFSCFAIADGLNRKTSSINTLSISAFALLMINPNYSLDVGFQLSYCAVLGILILMPELDKLWTFKSKLLEFFNAIFKVSLAAQLGILPLGLYYFHQFSALFFLANLLVVPGLMFLLYLGIFVLITNLSNEPIGLLNLGFDNGLKLMNKYINWITTWDGLILDNIAFDAIMMGLSYLLMIALFWFFKTKTYSKLVRVLLIIVVFQGYYVWRFRSRPKAEFVVFHKTKSTVLGFREGLTLTTYQRDSLPHSFVEDYVVGEGLLTIEINPLKPLYRISNNNLLLVDSLGIYDFKSTTIDWVLLRHSPKIHLEKLIKTLRPKRIIADGSNYKSHADLWRKTCKNLNIKFHDTAKDGAFIFPLKLN